MSVAEFSVRFGGSGGEGGGTGTGAIAVAAVSIATVSSTTSTADCGSDRGGRVQLCRGQFLSLGGRGWRRGRGLLSWRLGGGPRLVPKVEWSLIPVPIPISVPVPISVSIATPAAHTHTHTHTTLGTCN